MYPNGYQYGRYYYNPSCSTSSASFNQQPQVVYSNVVNFTVAPDGTHYFHQTFNGNFTVPDTAITVNLYFCLFRMLAPKAFCGPVEFQTLYFWKRWPRAWKGKRNDVSRLHLRYVTLQSTRQRFCCSCRNEVLHCATRSEQHATIFAEKAKQLARRGRRSVGSQRKKKKLRCEQPEVLHCATAVTSCCDCCEK